MNTIHTEPPPNQTPVSRPIDDKSDGRHDFDFLLGRWKIHNQRLARRLEDRTEWQEFEATQEVRPVLGGLGNIDRFAAIFPDGQPIEGMTIRIFDPQAKLWSLYWVDDRSCQMQPPVIGRFEAGVGQFYGDDVFKGKPIRVVFRWKVVSPGSAYWEQAFSTDGGKTWETNWKMTMTRSAS